VTNGAHPSGTVTFLFTDIEASTRLWETDPETMRQALAAHDEMLRAAVDARNGYVFSTGGDGFAVAFSRAGEAVGAAVEAQRALQAWPWPTSIPLRVRMGMATGEAQERDGDYFGPVLSRAARVMAAGHGGQILLSAATAALADGVDVDDLGVHRLRDLSGSEHLFQVRAEGLATGFPALRTLDAIPGNLPVQTTSFVGRHAAMEELVAAVRTHRLITLTGVGGVGKTRLAVQVAAEVVSEFPEGVWLVELAPLGDPAALPDVVATALGVATRAGQSVTSSLIEALSSRRLLLVLDNCEHVLDAAAELVGAILVATKNTTVMATSREGLRLGGEHLWAVPSLGVEGEASEGVELFVERAGEVNARFSVRDQADRAAVSAICHRLDGIPLAIELAAARMVSMSPQDVVDRLADRFRLLAGSRRGVERHQTLRHTVAWSYDLLDDDEKTVLRRSSVFAGGFDLPAIHRLCDRLDEYALLDVLDSLVRKSLVTVEHVHGHARYGLLETIRQFAEEQLAATGDIADVRDRHAAYYAAQAQAYWEIWDTPRMRVALDWVDLELANLRTGFRWAAEHDDLITATAIAAHTTLLAWMLGRAEPGEWAEELLPAATAADGPQLPRLHTAASMRAMADGRLDAAIGHARFAVALEADARYDGFLPGLSSAFEATGHFFAGRIERSTGRPFWTVTPGDR
jgi:predicted ATPase/class 3 adenylate cyclase